jgi:hypothetical protein
LSATTVHQPITAPIIRQNAITDPVDSDHLINTELVEKLMTAIVIAISPSARPLRRSRITERPA